MDLAKEFLISMLEEYSRKYKKTGEETYQLFERYRIIEMIMKHWSVIASYSDAVDHIHARIEKTMAEEAEL